VTLLCVPIFVQDVVTALADAAVARDQSADLVEFRLDDFFTGAIGPNGEREVADILRLVRESPLPCIITCRPAAGNEGGRYDGDEPARLALFQRLGTADRPGEHPPRYLDIELATYTRSENIKQKINLAVLHDTHSRDLQTSLILSLHDFSGRPGDLLRKLAAMRAESGAAVHKVAYHARSLRDNLELIDILAERDRPTIALAMGEFGLMSRVLAPKFGGFLTFASLRAASTTAPGQPTVRDLLDLYRFRSINPRTRVYGVIGFPVSQSLSPAIHNAGFESIGDAGWADLDVHGNTIAGTNAGGVYLPLPIPPEYEHFKATLGALLDHPRLTFSGCSVTIPHKEHLVRFAREELAREGEGVQRDTVARPRWIIDPSANDSGAANTLSIRRNPDGRIAACIISNTDGVAARQSLEEHLQPLTGACVGILGAGGAARSVACELLAAGASAVIFNRAPARAEALARDLSSRFAQRVPTASFDAVADHSCDALVNCTPVGMKGGPLPADSPLSATLLQGCATRAAARGRRLIVMDTVYNPVETPLLRVARQANLICIDGLEMFVRQAAVQFHGWTNLPAPVSVFHRVARELLSHNGSELKPEQSA